MPEKPLGWRPDWWEVPDSICQQIHKRAKELLPLAIEILGPAAQLDLADAEESILLAAEHYHGHLRAYETSPDRSDVRKALTEIQDHARWFASRLAGLDHFTIAALAEAGLSRSEVEAMEKFGETVMLRDLRRLESIARRGEVSIPSPSFADGKKLWQVAPRWEFVVDCLVIFEQYRPGEVSGNPAGDFHDFASLVFEMGTGKESGLGRKTVQKVVSKWKPLRKKIEEWERSPHGQYTHHLRRESRIMWLESMLASKHLKRPQRDKLKLELKKLREQSRRYYEKG